MLHETSKKAGNMKNNKGFTLIELLVVISVIAILIGIVVPRFKGMQDVANGTKAKAELKTLQTAVESWRIHQDPQHYPASTIYLCRDVLNADAPIIVSSPLFDPFLVAETEYIFELSPDGTYYVIYSVGPNSTMDITGVGDDGILTGEDVDDIYVTNGTGWS